MLKTILISQYRSDLGLRDKTVRDACEGDRVKAVLIRSEVYSSAAIAPAIRKIRKIRKRTFTNQW